MRLTPFQSRVLDLVRNVGVPPGAEPPASARVMVVCLMAWAKANGIDARAAAAADAGDDADAPDTRDFVREAGRR